MFFEEILITTKFIMVASSIAAHILFVVKPIKIDLLQTCFHDN